MDKAYEAYCLVDRVFYDSPLVARHDDPDYALAREPVPEGWRRAELDDWLVYVPEGAVRPPQGWKIHASARLDNAEAVLAIVWDYCVPRRIPFKFVRSRQLHFLANIKYAHRGSSGKFVTIYPADEAEFETILEELGALLEGQPGPYILSDLRWGPGPLYVRYGGFADRYCVGPTGLQEPAIEEPGGRLVPDRRGPAFKVPEWVELPRCLEPHLAARAGATVADLPYTVERALHFSNGGGVYAGVERETGDKVVLKEARPHAALALDEADAVVRLERERAMLERVAGLGVAPEVRDYLTVGEHRFLVMDFIDGAPLSSLIVERYPLLLEETPAAAAAEYTAWAMDVHRRVSDAVAAVHSRGVVIGDIHTANVLVRPDGDIVLIDLEGAWDARVERGQTMADPGFMAPRGVRGFDIDSYALALMRLALFMPLTSLLALDPGKAEQLAEVIEEHFPVPREFLAEALAVIDGAQGPRDTAPGAFWRRSPDLADPAGWERARDSLARGILLSATPERADRLFPGDVSQFPDRGLDLSHGAAGVLFALHATGAGRHPEHEEWLVRQATQPEAGVHMGFYDGLHGIAYVLERLGRRDDALRVLEICSDELDGKWLELGLDLQGGLAGMGLNLLHFAKATGSPELADLAVELGAVVADRLGTAESVPEISGGENPYAGLLRGSSGPALLFLRLHDRTGDSEYLDLAATALGQDLRRCYSREDGSLEVNEGWRTMPYLAEGSVGIGMVLDDYLARRHDERFATAAAAIRRAALAQFYIEPGLFSGRAGMILYLARGHDPGAAAQDPAVAAQLRRLAWHSLTYRGELAFPGEQLLRLSMDLATGSAGILLALGAAHHREPVGLPFLHSSGTTPRVEAPQPLQTAGRR